MVKGISSDLSGGLDSPRPAWIRVPAVGFGLSSCSEDVLLRDSSPKDLAVKTCWKGI